MCLCVPSVLQDAINEFISFVLAVENDESHPEFYPLVFELAEN